jgi:hypothetical protein
MTLGNLVPASNIAGQAGSWSTTTIDRPTYCSMLVSDLTSNVGVENKNAICLILELGYQPSERDNRNPYSLKMTPHCKETSGGWPDHI